MQEIGGTGETYHRMVGSKWLDAKTTQRHRRLREIIDSVRTQRDIANGLSYDIETMNTLMRSRIADVDSRNIAPEFKKIENGWTSVLNRDQQKLLANRLIDAAMRDPGRLGKWLGLDKDIIKKMQSEVAKMVEDSKDLDPIQDVKKKRSIFNRARKNIVKEMGPEMLGSLFRDRPPQSTKQLIAERKSEMMRVMDVVRGLLRVPHRSSFAKPISSIFSSLVARSGEYGLGRYMRLKTQRVSSLAQDLISRTVRHSENIEQLSKAEKGLLNKIIRQPLEEISASDYGKLRTLAIDIVGTRNRILDAAVDVGKLTIGEAKAMKARGYDPHFYLKSEYSRELRGYQPARLGAIDPKNVDTPDFSRLNVQRKIGTARVAWKNTAKGEWVIEDFPADVHGGVKEASAAARKFKDQLKKKYPGMPKDSIRTITPLTELELATKGLIKNDVEYQIKAMRDMVVDIGKSKLLNEIGLIQGLVRSNLDDLKNPKERGMWVRGTNWRV